jgi:flagellar biosynthesis/type III secretory pathway M-ring protein FliF/YscJ
MFDDFQKILDEIQKLPDPEKVAAAQTAFVTWCVAQVVYYLVAGVVTWALGRRIVQAVFAAWREAKRSSAAGQ